MGQGRNKASLPKIQWKWPHNISKFMGDNERSVKRTIHSSKCLHKKAEKKWHTKELTEHLKNLEKKKQTHLRDLDGSK